MERVLTVLKLSLLDALAIICFHFFWPIISTIFQSPVRPPLLPSAKLPLELFNPFHSSHLPASARSRGWTLTVTSSRTSWWTTPASVRATRKQIPTQWTRCPPATMPRRSALETRSAARRWTPSPGAAPSSKISVLWPMCKWQCDTKYQKPWSLADFVSCFSPACHSSWQTLRQSPIFGCICPNNLPNKKKCDKIFETVNGNDCIGKCSV